MTAEKAAWAVRLAATAQADYLDILRWTATQFGQAQAHAYAETLSTALMSLAAGPKVAGVRSRNDIAKGLFTLHVARRGRKGRHFVLFRIGSERGASVIDVLRLLHDAMDLARHLPADERGQSDSG